MYENFHRPEKLKEILFEINKEDEEFIPILDFIKIVNLKVIHMDSEKHRNKTYFEVLFN